jgi:hypothetical protein
MSTKTGFTCALVLAALTAGAASAQELVQNEPARLEPTPTAEPIPAPAVISPVSATLPAAPAGLSSWITYQQPGCCGPVGGHGEIFTELYARSGSSLVVSGELGDRLSDGWLVQGGVRSLFFNARQTAACTADLNLTYIYNSGGDDVPFTRNGFPVTIRQLHRTAGTLSFGRERYLAGAARSEGWRWRVGWDAGIRWGTTRLDLNDTSPIGFVRVNSWNYGPVLAAHTDLEIPRGCCSFVVGLRAEWAEMFNNRLDLGFDGDVTDINLLLTLGVRF